MKNPFKEYQQKKVQENVARIRLALAEIKKNGARVSYPLLSKMTKIPYSTLKSKCAAGKQYRAIIEAAAFENRDLIETRDLQDVQPKNLDEAKALLNVANYKYDMMRKKNEELTQLIKEPKQLLEALGFIKKQPATVNEIAIARDFCHLVERLIDANHLEFDHNNNIVPKGFPQEIRVPKKITEIYLTWREKVKS